MEVRNTKDFAQFPQFTGDCYRYTGELASSSDIPWSSFLVAAASSLGGGTGAPALGGGGSGNAAAASAMEVVCEARANHPDGASSTLPT